VVGDNKRRPLHLLVGVTLTIAAGVLVEKIAGALPDGQRLWSILGWIVLGLIATFFLVRWELRSRVAVGYLAPCTCPIFRLLSHLLYFLLYLLLGFLSFLF
jgi:hypothetical protein